MSAEPLRWLAAPWKLAELAQRFHASPLGSVGDLLQRQLVGARTPNGHTDHYDRHRSRDEQEYGWNAKPAQKPGDDETSEDGAEPAPGIHEADGARPEPGWKQLRHVIMG